MFIAALQQETQPPLTADVHGERKDRVTKLLFCAQLIVEPRLNNLSQNGTLRRTGEFIIARRHKHGGQRGIRAVACFFENHILFFLNQHILVAAPLVAF